MQYPLTLSDETRAILNGIDSPGEEAVAGNRGVFSYGFTGMLEIATAHTAMDVIQGDLQLDELIRMFDLRDFDRSQITGYWPGCFTGSREKIIEQTGIFVPRWRLNVIKEYDGLYFFDTDHLNGITRLRDSDQINEVTGLRGAEAYREAMKLTRRTDWTPEDLVNPELIEQVIRFGRNLWKVGLERVEGNTEDYYERCGEPDIEPDQRANLQKAGEELIRYYSEIVERS